MIEYWEVLKTYWYLPLIAYLPMRFIEWFVRFTFKKVFGVVFVPVKIIKKAVKQLSLFEVILMTLLVICFAIITYLSLQIYA